MESGSDGAYEVVIAARPYGPPLTLSEQALRAALAFAFIGLLVIEGWLLWNVWTLWA
jgi:hypothetical protein